MAFTDRFFAINTLKTDSLGLFHSPRARPPTHQASVSVVSAKIVVLAETPTANAAPWLSITSFGSQGTLVAGSLRFRHLGATLGQSAA